MFPHLRISSDTRSEYWLFSRNIDLTVFLGSAVLSLLLLAVGWQLGILNGESPEWTWVSAVLLIDVAHVWSTSFRVYFDVEEFKRRILALFAGARIWIRDRRRVIFRRRTNVLESSRHCGRFSFCSSAIRMGRALSKKAARAGRLDMVDRYGGYLSCKHLSARILDDAAAAKFRMVRSKRFLFRYQCWSRRVLFRSMCSLLPHTLRNRSINILRHGFVNIGKDIVVATTAICWYVGIVVFNSDYAFTVTNVIIHGVPYFALIYVYARFRHRSTGRIYRSLSHNWLIFLATLWALAYVEELFWHRGVWHEKEWLFGGDWDWQSAKIYLVPLLALPQLTHYVLDGFIWRRNNRSAFRLV